MVCDRFHVAGLCFAAPLSLAAACALICCDGRSKKVAVPVEVPLSSRGAPGAAPAGEEASPAQPAPLAGPVKPLVVIIGGDVILQDQIIKVADLQAGKGDKVSGWTWFFHALEPLLGKVAGDGEKVVVVNLESPVAEKRVEPKSYPPTFNGPQEALAGMRAAGVDIVTLSNNHALDQGRSGLAETQEAAAKAGLVTVGAGKGKDAGKPVLIGGGGGAARVALFSFLVPAGKRVEPESQPAVALYGDDTDGQVAAMESSGEVDATVVILHWIAEFVEKPPPEWREIAGGLVAAGADAVICHGPHVVGPAGWVEEGGRKGFVAYSLGNLVANFGWEVYPTNYKELVSNKTSSQRIEARREALCVLEFVRPPEGQGAVLSGADLYPLWLEDNRYASLRKGGAVRAIYPMPVPACVPADEVGCSKGSLPEECGLRWDMIFDAEKAMVENLWGKSWPAMQPCPQGADASNFPVLVVEY
jgi:hypothetical protein